jgi:hypothetical protein
MTYSDRDPKQPTRTGYQLPLHQLERERNRLILWYQQSSLNHYGRSHHGNGYVYS